MICTETPMKTEKQIVGLILIILSHNTRIKTRITYVRWKLSQVCISGIVVPAQVDSAAA